MNKKYYIATFGCQANERDSETIAGLLEKMGYVMANDLSQADIILFNTCCIREKAENKVLSKVGELKELKAQNPELIIGICGCMVQQEKIAEKIRHRAPQVDLIFGTHNLAQLPELINKLQETKTAQMQILSDQAEIREDLPAVRQVPFKARVNITYGCNNFCTYCIVPYVRGREKSRAPQNILAEIKKLVIEGVVEVLLLGQNVNSYGKTLEPSFSFARLLQEVNAIPGLKRIRYLTSHPRDFNQELITTISKLDKVCPHFHLPLQSGSNKILQKMNRGYTREHYQELVGEIRRLVPEASITTDIIVGFPGETEADFQDTLNLVEELHFDAAFTFIYSLRSGTPAAKMIGQIPLAVKKERLQKLMQLQNNISLAINKQLKGQVVEVLVEGPSKKDCSILEGRTETNKSVLFVGYQELIGKFVKVKITVPQTWVLKGEIIEER
ncbi:MAG: tRNA (N6-isopentenyl adenosine(37)-C2)-methylthiotransferase MiaB [Clostridia bacterium]|nr:tRNA (N6-isopentenyl adenosine(37)-C2)-methylthiotransferase MiaB [Clostridia bacterium]